MIPGTLFVLLVLAVWADPLFFRRSFAGRDLIAYNLPMEKTIHDAYARGEWPLWSPNISGGRPLLPNPNAGAVFLGIDLDNHDDGDPAPNLALALAIFHEAKQIGFSPILATHGGTGRTGALPSSMCGDLTTRRISCQ